MKIFTLLLFLTISISAQQTSQIDAYNPNAPQELHIFSLTKEPLQEIYQYMMQDDPHAALRVIKSNEVGPIEKLHRVGVFIERRYGQIVLVRPKGSRVQFYIFRWSLKGWVK